VGRKRVPPYDCNREKNTVKFVSKATVTTTREKKGRGEGKRGRAQPD